MLDFQKLTPADKERYEQILFQTPARGCEYSFANLYLWGKKLACFTPDSVALFAHYQGKSIYYYPVGGQDKRQQVQVLREDARQRGIPFRMIGMNKEEAAALEAWFPGEFYIQPDRDDFDYVYGIHDLADLKGRKYQKKRNHVNRFRTEHPNYRVEPLTGCNMGRVQMMVNDWYQNRIKNDPETSYLLENVALAKAFRHFSVLNMEGLTLFDGEEVLAVAMGSRMSRDTFDIHFEKAREDVDGAYSIINQEFARYLREKYPEIQFLDREEDMGLEGLRRAKLSYNPHHLLEKYWICCREDLNVD